MICASLRCVLYEVNKVVKERAAIRRQARCTISFDVLLFRYAKSLLDLNSAAYSFIDLLRETSVLLD
jgi:hypothetical protein